MGKRLQKRSGLFMKAVLAAIVLQVICYTWSHLFLSAKAGFEVAPVTSVAFYAFCGFEAGVCGKIQQTKINKND